MLCLVKHFPSLKAQRKKQEAASISSESGGWNRHGTDILSTEKEKRRFDKCIKNCIISYVDFCIRMDLANINRKISPKTTKNAGHRGKECIDTGDRRSVLCCVSHFRRFARNGYIYVRFIHLPPWNKMLILEHKIAFIATVRMMTEEVPYEFHRFCRRASEDL